MCCAGYNNVDLAAAKANGITVMRVPGYSPEAVAEHAMALAQAANRRICKAYIKVRNNNFALDPLKLAESARSSISFTGIYISTLKCI